MYNTNPIITVRLCAISDRWRNINLTEVEPKYHGMGPKPIRIDHVAEGQSIQLFETPASSGMDGQQDWPCYTDAHETYDHQDLQKSEEEVAIKGRMIEHMGVGNSSEGKNPIEPSCR